MLETLPLLLADDLVATLVPVSRLLALFSVLLSAIAFRVGHVRRTRAYRAKVAMIEQLVERRDAGALMDAGFTPAEVERLLALRRHSARPPRITP
jgi:hypothetical protein